MNVAQVCLRLATIKGHSEMCSSALLGEVRPPFASHFLHIELIRLLIVACGMLVHSSSMAVWSCWILVGGGTCCEHYLRGMVLLCTEKMSENLWVQLMKNGSKNKSAAFTFLFSVNWTHIIAQQKLVVNAQNTLSIIWMKTGIISATLHNLTERNQTASRKQTFLLVRYGM